MPSSQFPHNFGPVLPALKTHIYQEELKFPATEAAIVALERAVREEFPRMRRQVVRTKHGKTRDQRL